MREDWYSPEKYDTGMRIIVLSAFADRLVPALIRSGDEVIQVKDGEPDRHIIQLQPDYIICFSTRRILKDPIRGLCPAINLHASYLPFTRGPNPVIWRWIAGEPHGVSIHEIDGGVDTGPVFAQEVIQTPTKESLHQSRNESAEHLSALFLRKWPDIRARAIAPVNQPISGGTSYSFRDQEAFEDLLLPNAHIPLDQLLALIRNRLRRVGQWRFNGSSDQTS
jgi:methionyl-tRNA formyltransferase